MVRIWVPAAVAAEGVGSDGTLHGLVTHVGSGKAETFQSPNELLEAIRRSVADRRKQPARP